MDSSASGTCVVVSFRQADLDADFRFTPQWKLENWYSDTNAALSKGGREHKPIHDFGGEAKISDWFEEALKKQGADYLSRNKLEWPMIHHGIEDMSVEEEEEFTAGLADCLPASSEGSTVPSNGVDEVAIVPAGEPGA